MTRRDFAVVTIGPHRFEVWDSYELVSDLTTAADAFSFTVPISGSYEQRRSLLRTINEGVRVSAYVVAEPDAGPQVEALQMTGIVDRVNVTGGRNGTTLRIQGRDNGGLLVGAHVDPRLAVDTETTLVGVARQLLEPFGMEVTVEPVIARQEITAMSRTENAAALARARRRAGATLSQSSPTPTRTDIRAAGESIGLTGPTLELFVGGHLRDVGARLGMVGAILDQFVARYTSMFPPQWRVAERARRSRGLTGSDVLRIPLSEARPHVGETVWEFLERHCRRFGVLPWIDARGRLVIAAPDYDQEPLFALRRSLSPTPREPNTILEGGFVQDYAGLASEVTVYGRSHGRDASRSRFVGHATNPSVPVYRPIVIHDPSCASSEEAQRRAEQEISRQREDAYALEYEVPQHGQGARVYAVDTVVDVLDEAIGVEGLFYVAGRTFTMSRKEGARTRLRLVPLGAITA